MVAGVGFEPHGLLIMSQAIFQADLPRTSRLKMSKNGGIVTYASADVNVKNQSPAVCGLPETVRRGGSPDFGHGKLNWAAFAVSALAD